MFAARSQRMKFYVVTIYFLTGSLVSAEKS